jgi:hypothetical protein
MSSEPNPPLDNFQSTPLSPDGGLAAPLEQKAAPVENPVWSGWDVLLVVVITFLAMILVPLIATVIAHEFIYRGVPLIDVAQKPVLLLTSQLAGYAAVFCFMVLFIEGRYRISFFESIRWNWPSQRWLGLAALGIGLLIAIQALGHFLPMPKEVPFDKFFGNTRDAYFTSLFAISVGPFMEELLFRGFLYPTLARRLGMGASILLTGIAFGLVHGLQLSFAWGPVLMIVIVGIVLTTVRALKKSVAASLIVHIAYNFTLTALTFVGTGGFRHLDKLTQ